MSLTHDTDTNRAETLRALPLDAWHRARGGRMVPFAGHAMPVQFEGIIAEHLWTRRNAGLFDVSHMGQLLIAAPGADQTPARLALEALLPADLASLDLGAQRYSLLLDDRGGILDDLMITRWPGGFFLVVNGATRAADVTHIAAHLPAGVTLTERSDHGLLALQGPRAAEALASLGLEPAQPQIVPVERLWFMAAGPYRWNGADLHVSRSGYSGEDGYEIAVPVAAIAAFADALAAHPAVRPVGLGARDSLRLEAGLPLYGHDLTPDIDPVEAGLGFAIARRRRAEGGFPGHAKIVAALAGGPARRRVGLIIDGRLAAREGAMVLAGSTPVGTVTSGGFAPSLGHPIAMALIDAAHAAPGTPLSIDMRGRAIAARVVPMPFVPHRYHRKGVA
ncbi:glycine cleavage system aminomethyltransferase GcvT [Novosphingobium sp. FSW06-99]|uniref:glycine cleavage system aminomethyltransferase GcvT n=1 Tax=Novosphingobium sp. FSW06-99 TaxID=1739113 RepID=UPI0009E67C9D|nr:glycine cleavage system aminomethyltransferase GcvT [Novosphingobium sp. FSW06-99]